MIIDMRCRPPIEEFRRYFDVPRIAWHGARTGAATVSRAFVEGSMELFFEEMAQAGITLGVVQGRNSPERFMGTKFNEAFIANERIAELQDTYRGRLIGFGGIDVSNSAHDAVRETERCLTTLGLKGVFVEPGRALGAMPDDPRLDGIYEKCIEHGAPVSIMSGPYAGPDIASSDPVYIDRVATRFPKLKIVCGHGCYPYIQQIIGVAYKHTNVFVSPDMYMFAPGGRQYVEAANTSLREQTIFGSAYPLWPMPQAVADSRTMGFAEHALQDYFYGNAARVLGLERA